MTINKHKGRAKSMSRTNGYKRRIIQEGVDTCRHIIESDDPKRKTITVTQKEKSHFRNLGINFKAFLSNSQGEEVLVSITKMATEYLNAPAITVKKTFFKNEYRGLNKGITLAMLNKIEKVADEQFGTLEDMDDNDKAII